MDTDKRPVLTGLVALVAVAVVLGGLGGLGVMLGVKAMGIGGSSESSDDSSPSATFSLPRPTDTGSETPVPTETATEEDPAATESATPAAVIALSANQQSVAPMQQIDLTGTYPTGEGAILQVQRFEDGQWVDFPVTMSVSGSTFATYVQTSRAGETKFRVIDTDTQKTSNEITVMIG